MSYYKQVQPMYLSGGQRFFADPHFMQDHRYAKVGGRHRRFTPGQAAANNMQF